MTLGSSRLFIRKAVISLRFWWSNRQQTQTLRSRCGKRQCIALVEAALSARSKQICALHESHDAGQDWELPDSCRR